MTAPLSEPDAVGVAAPFGRRAFARLFDIAVVGVVALPVLTLTLRDDDHSGGRFPIVVVVLYGLLPALFEARLLARSGATPGKRLSGLLVVTGPGSQTPGPLRSFLRSLLTWSVPALAVLLLDRSLVAATIIVVYGPAAIPGLRRDLADLVSGTRVLYTGDIADDIGEGDIAEGSGEGDIGEAVTDDIPRTDDPPAAD